MQDNTPHPEVVTAIIALRENMPRKSLQPHARTAKQASTRMCSLQLALAVRQENIKAARALLPAMCLVRVALLQILVQNDIEGVTRNITTFDNLFGPSK